MRLSKCFAVLAFFLGLFAQAALADNPGITLFPQSGNVKRGVEPLGSGAGMSIWAEIHQGVLSFEAVDDVSGVVDGFGVPQEIDIVNGVQKSRFNNATVGFKAGLTAGSYPFKVKVTDTVEGLIRTTTNSYVLIIGTPITITGTFPLELEIGTSVTKDFTVSGGSNQQSGYNYDVRQCTVNANQGVFPENFYGLTATATGVAFQIHSNPPAGNYCFKISVWDDTDTVGAHQEYTFKVLAPPVIEPVATMTPDPSIRIFGTVGTLFSVPVMATLTPNDGFTVTYEIDPDRGGLPEGVSINAASGLVSGIPTVNQTGRFFVKATFVKGVGEAAKTYTIDKSYGWSINSSISLLNLVLADGAVGRNYSHDFDASGTLIGRPKFELYSLPPELAGLSINADTGILSGIPTAKGNYVFVVRVEDSANGRNGTGVQVSLKVIENVGPPVESHEITDIQEDGSSASATISSELITETVGDAANDALSDSPGSSPLVGYSNGAMIIVSKAKMSPGVQAIDELTVADRKAMRLRAGGSVPGLFNAFGETDGTVAAEAVDPARWSVWGSIRATGLETGASYNNLDGSQVNLLTGASYRWSPNFVAGAFGGYETFKYADDVGAKLDGNGLTAGAYVAFRVASSVKFDAQLSSTWLNYDIASGAVTGTFDATRIIASGGLTGNYATSGFIFEPSLRFTGTWEQQAAYVDTAATAHAARSFNFGKVSAGVKVSKPYKLSETANITPFAGIYADYRFSGGDVSAAGQIFDDLSARALLGFNAKVNESTTLNINGEISGIGAEDALLWSLKAQLGIQF